MTAASMSTWAWMPARASTTARILIDVGDGSAFATAGHLAAYAGLAPVTRTSGSSLRGEHPTRRGSKQLKRTFYLAAFASLSQRPAGRVSRRFPPLGWAPLGVDAAGERRARSRRDRAGSRRAGVVL